MHVKISFTPENYKPSKSNLSNDEQKVVDKESCLISRKIKEKFYIL